MLGIVYLYHKFPPDQDQFNAVVFPVFATLFVLGSLVSVWILVTQWHTLKAGERWRLGFYVLFL
jgi:hypothetical protein